MKANPEQAERLHSFAHDLRNRLIGLQQVLEQLKDDASGMGRAELALYGEQQYFKALREVEHLMDDLGVERGTVVPRLNDIAFAPLIRQRTALMDFRFQRKQQRIGTELDEELIVRADERIIGDLIDALLSNASKFSGSGSTVHVTFTKDGTDALLTVRDEGTGLNAEDLANTFTRFAWLASRPTAGEAQGRGTLARARQWARAHGGDLTVQSSGEGHGCTFILRLPRSA
jgi:signal transduction histidine kinase